MQITITLTKEQVEEVIQNALNVKFSMSSGKSRVETKNGLVRAGDIMRQIIEDYDQGEYISYGEMVERYQKIIGKKVKSSTVSSALKTMRHDGVLQLMRKGTYKKL